jgi:HAE1 family hydrophobic/amphiphilic exporter-1
MNTSGKPVFIRPGNRTQRTRQQRMTRSVAPALLVSAVFLAAPPANAGGTELLDLSQAIEEAVEANPEARRAREAVEEYQLLVKEVKADAFPQLNLTLAAGRYRDPGLLNNPAFGGGGDDGGDEPDFPFDPSLFGAFKANTFEYRFDLEQPIYTFGRVSHAIRAAREELRGVRKDVTTVERLIARDVAAAYYDLGLAVDRLETLSEERASRERQLQQVQDRYELEDATKLELLRAQVALANLQPRLLAAENLVRVARARLNETMGRPADSDVMPASGLELPDPLPQVPDLASLLELASRVRPELARFELSKSFLREAEGVRRADTLPEIAANASYGINSYQIDNLKDHSLHNWSVAVSLRWKLFDGFRTSSAVGQLRSQGRQVELQEQSFRSQLARELEQASGDWEQGLAAFEAAELAVTQSREAQRISEESYRWGAVTFLDVLESEREVRDAELSRGLASHAALVALAQIKYLVGLSADAPSTWLISGPPSEAGEQK